MKSANAATTAATLLRASVSVNHRAVSNSAKDGYVSEEPCKDLSQSQVKHGKSGAFMVQASQEGHWQTVPHLDHEPDESVDVRHLPGTAATQAPPFLQVTVFPREIQGNAEF